MKVAYLFVATAWLAGAQLAVAQTPAAPGDKPAAQPAAPAAPAAAPVTVYGSSCGSCNACPSPCSSFLQRCRDYFSTLSFHGCNTCNTCNTCAQPVCAPAPKPCCAPPAPTCFSGCGGGGIFSGWGHTSCFSGCNTGCTTGCDACGGGWSQRWHDFCGRLFSHNDCGCNTCSTCGSGAAVVAPKTGETIPPPAGGAAPPKQMPKDKAIEPPQTQPSPFQIINPVNPAVVPTPGLDMPPGPPPVINPTTTNGRPF